MSGPNNKQRYVIGIDPGKTTGMSVYCRKENKIIDAWSGTFWEIWGRIEHFPVYPEECLVIVESPRSKAVWHKGATSRGAIERTAVNVGSVLRESELWIEGMEREGYEVQAVHPSGKMSRDVVKKITGWEQRTNQHQRDAIMLAWGK